jgi:hypothetical protein
MFWVALATAIMMLSGEGDDSRAILALFQAMRASLPACVADPARRSAALAGVERSQALFLQHRKRLEEVGKCIEDLDRRYQATAEDYERCSAGLDEHNQTIAHGLALARLDISKNLTEAEWQDFSRRLDASPEVLAIDPAVRDASVRPGGDERRLPGLGGRVSARHMTTPRNSLQLLLGPLSTPTFAQNFPSRSIDAGASYARAADGSKAWAIRGGVAFGLFDDIEAGALFLQFQLSPDFYYDDILVYLTKQFRLKNVDLGLRFSFLTPTHTNWAINPGVSAAWHLGYARLDAAVLAPLEIRDPLLAGLGFSFRYTQNLTPHWFSTLETGALSNDLSESSAFVVPGRVGAGYTGILGSRVFDVTGLVSWDRLFSPGAAPGSEFNGNDYRIVFGFTFHNKVL